MKTYYYSLKETREKKIRVHIRYEASIYKIEKTIPIKIATAEFNSGAMMGEDSEVVQALVKAGILPFKYKGKYAHEIPNLKLFKL